MFLHHATDDHLKYWKVNVDTHIKGCQLIKPGVKYVKKTALILTKYVIELPRFAFWIEFSDVAKLQKSWMNLWLHMECWNTERLDTDIRLGYLATITDEKLVLNLGRMLIRF